MCLSIEESVYFMDRGFMHSSLHKLCKGVKTMLPCVKGVDDICSGLRINATDDKIVAAAKRIIRALPGKKLKEATDRVDPELIKDVVKETRQKMKDQGFRLENDDDPDDVNYPQHGIFVYSQANDIAVAVADDIKVDEQEYDSDETKHSDDQKQDVATQLFYIYSLTFSI